MIICKCGGIPLITEMGSKCFTCGKVIIKGPIEECEPINIEMFDHLLETLSPKYKSSSDWDFVIHAKTIVGLEELAEKEGKEIDVVEFIYRSMIFCAPPPDRIWIVDGYCTLLYYDRLQDFNNLDDEEIVIQI